MTVRTLSPPATIVHLSGDIDIFTTAQLRRRLLNALDSSTGALQLDLAQVTFCSAGGLGVLLGVQARAKAQGVALTLASVPPFMLRLLHVTGLARRFPIAPSPLISANSLN
ncbi:STAS domain-containing protein [Nonomuraea sp. NPDC050310]|uniref:STAS domain-containing protein n=1 Tax=unclassified Nonomuraea TaxID=2593643 RepID=UPI0033D2A6D2